MKKFSADMELGMYPKPFNIYLRSYKAETAVFIAINHKKNNYGSYLNVYVSFILNFWTAIL